jgi:ribosomal protein S13
MRAPYSVVLYDFNLKNKHTRVSVNDPGELRGLPLDRWLERSDDLGDAQVSFADQYFPQPGPRLCSVYDFAGRRTRGTPSLSYVSAEARKTPGFLYWALSEGFTSEVEAAMQYAVANVPQDKLAGHICSRVDGYDGPLFAFANGHEAALGAWISAVLGAPSSRLSNVDKVGLLGRLALRNNGFDLGRHGAVARFASLIADFAGLDESVRVRLLAPEEIYRIAEGAQLVNSNPDLVTNQHETIFRYFQEVARATGLQKRSKLSVLGARGGNPVRTAAQAALANGNPGAAAAMLCGILEGASPSELPALLGALGVSTEVVLRKLAASPRPEDTAWISRLEAASSSNASRPRGRS